MGLMGKIWNADSISRLGDHKSDHGDLEENYDDE